MKFSIYIKGRNWTFQLAESLLRSDNLNYLVTDYPKFYVKKYKIPSNKVKSFTFLYILQRILRHFIFPILKKIKIKYDPIIWIDWLADTFFSLFIIKNSDFLLLGFGNSTVKIIKKAKKNNIKTIYFLNSSSQSYQKVVRDEYDKLGLSKLYIDPPKKYLKRLNDSIKMADYTGVLSSFQKQTYLDEGFDESKMFFSFMGVDPTVFFPKKIKKDKFIVISVGNSFIRKGVKYLIDAFNSLKLDNSELWIVGNNPRSLAEKVVKIEKNNIFIDSVSEFKLPDLYNQSSIFCLPTFEEGLPAVIPQAMACALPIISTPYVKDYVTDGQEGFIIKFGSTSLISEKIKFFYDNPNKIIEMGTNARNKVENEFTFDSVAKRIVNFCNEKQNP